MKVMAKRWKTEDGRLSKENEPNPNASGVDNDFIKATSKDGF